MKKIYCSLKIKPVLTMQSSDKIMCTAQLLTDSIFSVLQTLHVQQRKDKAETLYPVVLMYTDGKLMLGTEQLCYNHTALS